MVQTDASMSGIDACLMQDGHLVAYASRSLTDTEKAYAQIEKECFSCCYGLEKFHTYCYGRHVIIENDHKPLMSIFSKALNNEPRRLQRMMLRLQNNQFTYRFKPGSQVVVADALSRAFPTKADDSREAEQNFTENVASVDNLLTDFQRDLQRTDSINFVVASTQLKQMLIKALVQDAVVNDLKPVIQNGWPEDPKSLPEHLTPFYNFRDELVIEENLLYKGTRLYVPTVCREEVLDRIHASHIGLNGCLRRARESVFWPNMTKHITKRISRCAFCAKVQSEQSNEPLMSHEIPERPWQRVGCDLFQYNSLDYLITVDYYSNFFEVDRLITDKKR